MAKLPRIYYLIASFSQYEIDYITQQTIPFLFKEYILSLFKVSPAIDKMKVIEDKFTKARNISPLTLRRKAYNIIIKLLFERYFKGDSTCLQLVPLLFLKGIYSGIRQYASRAFPTTDELINWQDEAIWHLLHPAWELLWYQAISGEAMLRNPEKIIKRGKSLEATLRSTVYTKIIETASFGIPNVFENPPINNPIIIYLDKITRLANTASIKNYILSSRIIVYMAYSLFKYQYFSSLSKLLQKTIDRALFLEDKLKQMLSSTHYKIHRNIVVTKAPVVILGALYPVILYGSIPYGTISDYTAKKVKKLVNSFLSTFNLDYVPGHQKTEFLIRYAWWLLTNGFIEEHDKVISTIQHNTSLHHLGHFSSEYYNSAVFWKAILNQNISQAQEVIDWLRHSKHSDKLKQIFISYIYEIITYIEFHKPREAWIAGDKCYQWARRHRKYIKIARLLRHITRWAHIKGSPS